MKLISASVFLLAIAGAISTGRAEIQTLFRGGCFTEAEAALQEALRIFEGVGHKRLIYGCRSSLCEIYACRGEFREAEALGRQLIDTVREWGATSIEADRILGLGYIHFQAGDLEQAE